MLFKELEQMESALLPLLTDLWVRVMGLGENRDHSSMSSSSARFGLLHS
ncbi:hypothetical protein M595_2603 [Lyngbya aestuarii BL J]|uniref:Uncharacterized protein n=1 Tax=Lyngbya aestuarii BL J TaxID=1348334 RepID=U7QHG0_9CYAN|nr:hypothetical protein M595_2603 [Lyngbya aestuarii BL J]